MKLYQLVWLTLIEFFTAFLQSNPELGEVLPLACMLLLTVVQFRLCFTQFVTLPDQLGPLDVHLCQQSTVLGPALKHRIDYYMHNEIKIASKDCTNPTSRAG